MLKFFLKNWAIACIRFCNRANLKRNSGKDIAATNIGYRVNPNQAAALLVGVLFFKFLQKKELANEIAQP